MRKRLISRVKAPGRGRQGCQVKVLLRAAPFQTVMMVICSGHPTGSCRKHPGKDLQSKNRFPARARNSLQGPISVDIEFRRRELVWRIRSYWRRTRRNGANTTLTRAMLVSGKETPGSWRLSYGQRRKSQEPGHCRPFFICGRRLPRRSPCSGRSRAHHARAKVTVCSENSRGPASADR
jgi:hypothetical protein